MAAFLSLTTGGGGATRRIELGGSEGVMLRGRRRLAESKSSSTSSPLSSLGNLAVRFKTSRTGFPKRLRGQTVNGPNLNESILIYFTLCGIS